MSEPLRTVEGTLRRLLDVYRIPAADREAILERSAQELADRWESILDGEAWLTGWVKRQCVLYQQERRRKPYVPCDPPSS